MVTFATVILVMLRKGVLLSFPLLMLLLLLRLLLLLLLLRIGFKPLPIIIIVGDFALVFDDDRRGIKTAFEDGKEELADGRGGNETLFTEAEIPDDIEG